MTGRRFSGNAYGEQFIPAINIAGIRTRQIPELDIPDLPGAACDGIPDPDIFFPRGLRRSPLKIAKAKAICGVCPVRQACLEWCLEWEHKSGEVQSGIWGGLTEWERADSDAPKRRFCQSGRHEMVGENLVVTGAGVERCRACRREANAASKRRIREAGKIGA